MFALRRATIDDLDVLLQLRMTFFEAFRPVPPEVRGPLEVATRSYLVAAIPDERFAAWLAVAEGSAIGCGAVRVEEGAPILGRSATSRGTS